VKKIDTLDKKMTNPYGTRANDWRTAEIVSLIMDSYPSLNHRL